MNRFKNWERCDACYSSDGTYVTVFGTRYMCSACTGTGRVPTQLIDMRHLRDCIAARGINADLYMSGGNCATIGIGDDIPETGDPHTYGGDYAYFVGVGTYHNGVALRDELSAGSDEYFHVPTPNAEDGTPQFPHDPYAICIGDNEHVEAFAARIADQYAQLVAAHQLTPTS